MKLSRLFWFVALAVFVAPVPGRSEPAPVKIASVDVGVTPAGPIVLLVARGRAIPISVDATVALSIGAALAGTAPPRPMTHDLMGTILQSFDAKVVRVSITLKEETYYADLFVSVKGKERKFDSRSSDAIALAVRAKAPIYVGEDLLESAGKPLADPSGQRL
jgi:bifunctional DNase/RNase